MAWSGYRGRGRGGGALSGDLARKAVPIGVLVAVVVLIITLVVVISPVGGAAFFGPMLAKGGHHSKSHSKNHSKSKKDSSSDDSSSDDSSSGDSGGSSSDGSSSGDSGGSSSDDSSSGDSGGSSSGGSSGSSGDSTSGGSTSGDSTSGGSGSSGSSSGDSGSGNSGSSGSGTSGTGSNNSGSTQQNAGCTTVITDMSGLDNAINNAKPNDVICVRINNQTIDGNGSTSGGGNNGSTGGGNSNGNNGSTGGGNSGNGASGGGASVNSSALPTGLSKQEHIWLTGYSWQDNTPPSSSIVSHPILHKEASGTGTYEDPITVAVPGQGNDIWKAGGRFYLPTVQRYVIVEDTGASPPHSGEDGHLDMWIGGQGGSKSATDSCMNKITGDNVPAQYNPPPNLPVLKGPIYGNGGCNIPDGGGSSKD